MNKEKTIKEWLETLPDGYREGALANMDQSENINICKGLPEATGRAFVWKNTPEGHEFWKAVWVWAYGFGELPQLPEEEK